ncbi:hydrogenase expression/formation protein [Bradyrhizobium barranii]|uniref:hydrogenase expression/formation protein n=1 Tax=Bradyrhizobium barranii TaxID=2992140 RepID=UPI001CCCEF22|nr:hydrogenase expression/formation protein [Bradyrhizobium barranii]
MPSAGDPDPERAILQFLWTTSLWIRWKVGGVPIVASAADEDLEDSAERLQEIIEAYFT